MPAAHIGEIVRAHNWDDYIGQERVKTHLEIKIDAARRDNRAFDHTLLVGPPGAGKTTLAKLIAQRLSDEFVSLIMPFTLQELVRFIDRFEGGVVLLDEIHNFPIVIQEALQPALEDNYIQGRFGDRVDCSHITFIGATTTNWLPKVVPPLVDRFKYMPVWAQYSDEEIALIVEGMARRADVDLSMDICRGLARAAGGTPRIASEVVASARDLFATDREVTVESVLDLAGYDADGLTERHYQYLRVLHELDGRAGLKNLVNMLRMSAAVIEEMERLLLTRGYVRLESNGRKLTPEGRDKLPATQRLSRGELRDRNAAA